MAKKNIYAQRTAKDGTMFKVQYNKFYGTLFVKEKNNDKWQKVQSSQDLSFLKDVMDTQREFRGNLK